MMDLKDIDVNQTENDDFAGEIESEIDEKLTRMEGDIRRLFNKLQKPRNLFSPEKAFDDLVNYIANYDRILYSSISNVVYANFEQTGNMDPSGSLMSNLDELVRCSENTSYIANKKQCLSGAQTEKTVDDARKAVWKIRDHVNLARQQYTRFKQSDDEYDRKFKERIAKYTQELNGQMLSMVSIFTALAFLVFGSIDSLDGIFENASLPLFKTMSLGLIWGICIFNMIFVFLYFVQKMTKLDMRSSKGTYFQKYPVFWWSNLTLVTLLAMSLWGHFIQKNKADKVVFKFVIDYPHLTFWLGTVIILLVAIGLSIFLYHKTKVGCENDMDE